MFLQNKLFSSSNNKYHFTRQTSAANHLPSFALRHSTSSISSGGGLQNVFDPVGPGPGPDLCPGSELMQALTDTGNTVEMTFILKDYYRSSYFFIFLLIKLSDFNASVPFNCIFNLCTVIEV